MPLVSETTFHPTPQEGRPRSRSLPFLTPLTPTPQKYSLSHLLYIPIPISILFLTFHVLEACVSTIKISTNISVIFHTHGIS